MGEQVFGGTAVRTVWYGKGVSAVGSPQRERETVFEDRTLEVRGSRVAMSGRALQVEEQPLRKEGC